MSQSIFYVYEIKQCIDWIRADTANHTFDTFSQSRRDIQLVERNLLVISEATRKLPDEFIAHHASIPWADIKGIGNVLRHDYADVMPTVLWSVVTDHLSPLADVIDAAIVELERDAQ